MARKKPMKAPGGVDHISDLPDNLLIHILSSLPTKHAIRTSLLSKRWQWLWIHVPVLEIEICRPLGDDPRELLFLDKALDLHTSPKITKLNLSGHRIPVLDEGVVQRLDLLVRSAVACHVEDLSLYFFSLDGKFVYTLPEEIYSCGSLRELKTMGCRFFPNGRVAWSSLRVLEVASGTWSDDMIAGLLAGCPALESLTLRFFTGIRLIDVKSPTRLKELVMDGCFDIDGNPELCIHAPYLEELELLGIWEFLRPNLVNVGSLVNVHLSLFFLDFKQNPKANTVTKLLEMVPQVKQLKIESWNMEDLSRENWPYPPLSSLNYLVVNVCFCLDHHLLVLRNLFRCAPTLDSLTLQFSHSCCTLEPRYDDKISDALTSRVEKLGGLLSNVKIVKLLEIGLTGRWFKLSEFLLKDLMMLEKMIIYPVPSLQTKSLLQLTKSLLSLPRSSPRAVVMIQ